MNNWFVITGGPSSGKTTTIDLLKSKGFKTTEESARKYFDSQAALGLTIDEIRGNQQAWQDAIAKLQVQLENSLNPDEQIFLDRAIPDAAAYYDFLKLNIPSFFKKAYSLANYKKVFFLERLPMIADGVRNETVEEAQMISDSIYRRYSELKQEIIKVPVTKREDRLDFIISKIS